MAFAAPLLLLGLAAILVPVYIHLRAKPQARRVAFGAVELLRRAERHVHRRLRLREILLFLARTAIVVVLVLGLARPFARVRTALPIASLGPASTVVVLDDSLSMRYRRGRDTLFDRARDAARDLIGSMGPDDEVGIVLGRRPVARLTRALDADRNRVRSAVDDAHASVLSTDLHGAVELARQMLAGATRANRRIVVLSDLARTAVGSTGLALERDGADVLAYDVAEGRARPNAAVVSIEAEPASGAASSPDRNAEGATYAIRASVANFSDSPIRDLGVDLVVEGDTVARGLLDLAPGETKAKTFRHRFARAGAYAGYVQIASDALPDDDRRYFLVDVRADIRILVVNGDPRPSRLEDEVFYLTRALAPGTGQGATLATSVIDADRLDAVRLQDYEAVFLCNVRALGPAVAARIADFARAGGGVFISVGDHADPQTYGATMGDLLPARLLGVRTFAQTDPPAPAAAGEHLLAPDRRHAIFEIFAPGGSGLVSARFSRIVLLEPTAVGAPARRTLLRFESGAPALVERPLGRGTVLFFASTLDRDWTDFPIRTGYLPFVQQAARYLARVPVGPVAGDVLAGQPHQIPLGAEAERIVVRSPSGRTDNYPRAELSGRSALEIAYTRELGVYRVRVQRPLGGLREDPALSFAVNADPAESDLRPAPAHRVRSRGAGAGRARGPKRKLPLWPYLLAALPALLLVELVAGGRR